MAIYNKIGKSYDLTRKADPEIVDKIYNLLNLGVEPGKAKILDIGCGSGNYTIALKNKGLDIEGVDISQEMLTKARSKNKEIKFNLGDACNLSKLYHNQQFDGGICVLATHHIKNLSVAFEQISRILKNGANLVIFTATPTQMKKYWLNYYFPEIMKSATIDEMRDFENLQNLLINAGFLAIKSEPFFVTDNLQDMFLHSGKYRPEIYLEQKFRDGISTFAKNTNHPEIKSGLKKLKEDINSKKINQIIADHETKLGEYLFVSAKRLPSS
jgi:ubiquinone/menaquinone biosynthesis C-methylase UbiE